MQVKDLPDLSRLPVSSQFIKWVSAAAEHFGRSYDFSTPTCKNCSFIWACRIFRIIRNAEFQEKARQTVNPLAGNHPSRAIIDVIEATDFAALGPKIFYNVEMAS